MSLVLTKAAVALNITSEQVQVVKFQKHKPKKKRSNEVNVGNVVTIMDDNMQIYNPKEKDLDIKKMRHEIYKFGMSGFDPTNKEAAKIALAVRLGAKPPKKEYVNYKELMNKSKEDRIKQQEEKKMMIAKSVMQKSCKRSKNKNEVGHFLSTYGKVQKSDLKKDEKRKKKKNK